MKNSKGFTLIELLAVVVILGILIGIAIPNTISLIDKNKKTNYIENAKTFVSLVQNKVETDKSIELPASSSQVLVVTLGFLNTSDVKESPYGEDYDEDASFVAITLESNKYTYYVHLVSCNSSTNCSKTDLNNWRGIEMVEVSKLNGDDKYNYVVSSGVNVGLINNLTGNTNLSGKTPTIMD